MIEFDSSPTIYWLIGYLLAGIVVLSAFSKKTPNHLFLGLGLILLVCMRLPAIVFNRELNSDESQVLSHAITLFQDPIYWQSADGTTIGPLDIYVLLIPKIFGFQIDYTSARIIGLLCAGGAFIFLFYTLRNLFNEGTARITMLAPLLFLSFTQETDFVHYSSEQVPFLLLSAILFLLSQIISKKGIFTMKSYLLGLLAGMVPFAKLQAVPVAAVLVLLAYWTCYVVWKNSRTLRPAIALSAGGLTFPLLVLGWSLYHGVFDDLLDFYVFGNVIYAGAGQSPAVMQQFFNIINLSPDFKAFFIILSIPIAMGMVQAFRQKQFLLLVLGMGLLLSSIYAITKSGNDFVHYLYFLILPWSFLSAWGLRTFLRQGWLIPVFLLAWFGYQDGQMYLKNHQLNAFVSTGARSLEQSEVVVALKKYSLPKDYMAVWGWQCKYYVEAQLAEATAENHSERSIFKHAMQDKYLNRYVSDIKRTKPAIFIDAVGKNSQWVQDRTTQGFENFPALAQYIQEHYTYRGLYDDSRLYVRNDRL